MIRSALIALLAALILAMPVQAIPIRRVVVVGGGPAGLSAAIALRQAGLEVSLLEARDQNYSRQFHLGLRADAAQVLDSMGALEPLLETSGYSADDLLAVRSIFPQTSREAAAMLTDSSPLVVRISDLESIMAQRAIALGVDYRANTTLDFSTWPRPMAQKGAMDIAGGFHPEGKPTSLGEVDLIVAAEGTKSPTREHLGIAFRPEGPATWFTGILWARESPVTYQRWIRSKPDGFRQHITTLGHKRYPETWALVELEPKAAYMARDERTAYACAELSAVLGETLRPEQILWGGLFSKVQNRRAERVVEGQVAIVGEAARAGFAWSSAGANLAIVNDTRSLLQLVSDLRAGSPGALPFFEASVQKSSDAWLNLDIEEFSAQPEKTAP